MPDGTTITLRRAVAGDAEEITAVMHDAFSIWKIEGFRFGPMYQTEATTADQIKGRVVVAEDASGKIIGTFGLDADGAALLEYLDVHYDVPPGKLLAFKKAAVSREKSHRGLGSLLYAEAEKIGRGEGYRGMILETVADARWLYEWYLRLGFKPLGSYRYPGSKVDTVLMIKLFNDSPTG